MHKKIPVFFTKSIITPGRSLPFQVYTREERKIILHHHQSQEQIGLVYRNGSVTQNIGCFVSIKKLLAARSGGMLDILIQGEQRFKIKKCFSVDMIPHAAVKQYRDFPIIRKRALDKQLIYTKRVLKKWAIASQFRYSASFIESINPFQLSFFAPSLPLFSTFELQALLEMRSLPKRLLLIEEHLQESLYKQVLFEELSSQLTEAFEKENILN